MFVIRSTIEEYTECGLLHYDTFKYGRVGRMFRWHILPPSSVYRLILLTVHFERRYDCPQDLYAAIPVLASQHVSDYGDQSEASWNGREFRKTNGRCSRTGIVLQLSVVYLSYILSSFFYSVFLFLLCFPFLSCFSFSQCSRGRVCHIDTA